MITVYNSLSRKEEPLPDQKKIRLFVCGPTVYDYLHIGNARTYIFFDFFAKYLRSQGYDVDYLQNITDIDDKIIARAALENTDPAKIAKFFTDAFLKDMRAVGVDGVTTYAHATDFISQIVAQVNRLIDKGFAYKIEGDGWYFDISKDDDYGKLSGRTVAQAEDGVSRIDDATDKKNKGDFCLWKFSKPGEPSWPSTLDAGRPGWHIEDTAISEFYFTDQYEIHGGGVDLKFPHHEAEIAQQESASGRKPFVKIWMHAGALLMEGKKMSKSLGNSMTIRDFLEKYPAEVLRFLSFKNSYASPLDYSDDEAQRIKKILWGIAADIKRLEIVSGKKIHGKKIDREIFLNDDVKKVLNKNINLPDVMAFPFEWINAINKNGIWDTSPEEATLFAQKIWGLLEFLGMPMFDLLDHEIPQKVIDIAEQRALARDAAKLSRDSEQFNQANALRETINELGYEVQDKEVGFFLWPKLDLWQPQKNHN